MISETQKLVVKAVKFNPEQNKILYALENNNRLYLQMPRRAGMSTILSSLLIYHHINNPISRTAFFHPTISRARNESVDFCMLFEKADLGVKIQRANPTEVQITTDAGLMSSVHFMSESHNIRGWSINNLIFDGFEQISNKVPEELMRNSVPALTANNGNIVYGCNACNHAEMKHFNLNNAKISFMDDLVDEMLKL